MDVWYGEASRQLSWASCSQSLSLCTTAPPGRGPCELSLPGTFADRAFFYSQCLTRKCLTLKPNIKIMEYNIRNDINLYKVILERFSLARRFQDIHISKFVTENVYQSQDIQHSQCTIRWQISDFLSDSKSNVCIFSIYLSNSHLKSLT